MRHCDSFLYKSVLLSRLSFVGTNIYIFILVAKHVTLKIHPRHPTSIIPAQLADSKQSSSKYGLDALVGPMTVVGRRIHADLGPVLHAASRLTLTRRRAVIALGHLAHGPIVLLDGAVHRRRLRTGASLNTVGVGRVGVAIV